MHIIKFPCSIGRFYISTYHRNNNDRYFSEGLWIAFQRKKRGVTIGYKSLLHIPLHFSKVRTRVVGESE